MDELSGMTGTDKKAWDSSTSIGVAMAAGAVQWLRHHSDPLCFAREKKFARAWSPSRCPLLRADWRTRSAVWCPNLVPCGHEPPRPTHTYPPPITHTPPTTHHPPPTTHTLHTTPTTHHPLTTHPPPRLQVDTGYLAVTNHYRLARAHPPTTHYLPPHTHSLSAHYNPRIQMATGYLAARTLPCAGLRRTLGLGSSGRASLRQGARPLEMGPL